jgi:YbbR domain-containing protein
VEEKYVAVQIDTQGELAEGFEIYSETVNPQRVRVRGPAAFLRSLISASTEPVDIAGRNGDFSVSQVPVDVSNPKATVLDTVVDVSFRIGERRVERTFVVSTAGETDGKRAAVVLFGPRSILDILKPEEVSVEVTKNEDGDTVNRLLLPAAIDGTIELRRLRMQE